MTHKPDLTKEMRKPLLLAFRTGDKSYRFFQIVGWKARAEFAADHSDDAGRYVCDCVRFKIESRCEHVELLDADVRERVYGATDWRDEGGIIPWATDEPFAHVLVVDQETNRAGVMDDDLGDLSLERLCWHLTQPGETSTAKGKLNPRRIFAEVQASEAGGLTINHPDVAKAGKRVAPITPVDAGEDEDLGDPLEAMKDADEVEPEEAKPTPAAKAKAEPGLPAWKKVKRPNSKDFYVKPEVWEALQYALHTGENIMLIGPSGSGKSEVCYLAAKAAGLPLEAFNMGATTEPRLTLIGATHFSKDEGTWFSESRFVRSVKRDAGACLLDEVTRASLDAGNILLPLLDRQGYLPLDEGEGSPVIHRGAKVCMMATANVGMTYTGTTAMDTALKQRFGTIIAMDYPPAENEVRVLMGRCPGLELRYAQRLVNIATDQRRLARAEEQFQEEISTRMLISAGEKIAAGMDFKVACEFAIVNFFSEEGGDASERTQVRQIIQKAG